jgi:hypothetical protein
VDGFLYLLILSNESFKYLLNLVCKIYSDDERKGNEQITCCTRLQH